MTKLDLTGQRFGLLVVGKDVGRTPAGMVRWECPCDCGGTAITTSTKLKSGHTKSCGCLKNRPSPHQADLAGQTFGRLLVIEPIGRDKFNRIKWLCRCNCGRVTNVDTLKLTSGNTSSCGCIRREMTALQRRTHGLHAGGGHPLASTWDSMKDRCRNPKNKSYAYYGGRGIYVCSRWLNGEDGKPAFQCFVEDMGARPTPQHSIDRYPDNDGPYSPDNCRWATKSEQRINQRPAAEARP